MTGFENSFMEYLGVKALRPEDLRWTELQTKEEWIGAVRGYFNPQLPDPQFGSSADRYGTCCPDFEQTHAFPDQTLPHISSSVLCDPTGLHWVPPSVPALCFPLIQGATDYHWAVYNGTYWLEQAGHGGPLNIWASLDGMIDDIYNREAGGDKFYAQGSHFSSPKGLHNQIRVWYICLLSPAWSV